MICWLLSDFELRIYYVINLLGVGGINDVIIIFEI